MIYKVKHPDHPGLAKVLTNSAGDPITVYVDGQSLIPLLAHLLPQPWTEEALSALKGEGFSVTVEREQSTHERIGLWCKMYKHFKGLPYRVSSADSGRMKNMPITEALLRYYLDDAKAAKAGATGWLWKGKQSVANLQRYWNEVRTSMVAPEPSKHPDHWDKAHYMRLDGQGISEYMRHLKAKGLVAKKHRDGSILDFVPAQ